MSVNKVILIGNVGKDPETRYLDNNLVVCRFPLATSEAYKNRSGETVTATEWHNIVLWNKLAEIAEKYVVKGKQLYIEGRIRTRSWEDKEGNKRYTTEINADNMQMLGRKSDDDSSSSQSSQDNYQNDDRSEPNKFDSSENSDNGSDDLPF